MLHLKQNNPVNAGTCHQKDEKPGVIFAGQQIHNFFKNSTINLYILVCFRFSRSLVLHLPILGMF
jgi:hypothetical protein